MSELPASLEQLTALRQLEFAGTTKPMAALTALFAFLHQ